jgi:hypothetical protein
VVVEVLLEEGVLIDGNDSFSWGVVLPVDVEAVPLRSLSQSPCQIDNMLGTGSLTVYLEGEFRCYFGTSGQF